MTFFLIKKQQLYLKHALLYFSLFCIIIFPNIVICESLSRKFVFENSICESLSREIFQNIQITKVYPINFANFRPREGFSE